MNVGEKVRSLRLAKLMTQSELAGSRITRNMLSCIENGSAQPSLPTIIYLAGRLGVPVGFLLAEKEEEIIYRKMNGLSNIKRAYRGKDYAGCRMLCLSLGADPDDEISLLLAECDAEIAEEAFHSGRLRFACHFFDEALQYASETVYPLPHVEARAEVFFRYMRRISPTLYSENLDDEKLRDVRLNTPFAAYVDALEALDRGEDAPARLFSEQFPGSSFYATHLNVRLLMLENRFEEARVELLTCLRGDQPLNPVSLYAVLCDLEICCRETEDFKGAYRYANEKVQQLEQLLRES